jgi:cell division septum initiation protein DivIVA
MADIEQISRRLRNATPANWIVDVAENDFYLIVRRDNEKNVTDADIEFFDNVASDVAQLISEVVRLRDKNAALQRQIIIYSNANEENHWLNK